MTARHPPFSAAVLAVLLSLGAAACKKDAQDVTSNTLLAYVPEDTPYLAANLEPLPADVIDATFERAQPLLDALQGALADVHIEVRSPPDFDDRGLAILASVLSELDGKLSRSGLESLGLKVDAHQVIYGHGLFPVIRFELSSAEALRATIGRIEASAGFGFPRQQHGGRDYWRFTPADFGGPGHHNAALYVAILEDGGLPHLALGLFPTSAEAELLPAFLGAAKPAANTVASRLAGINHEQAYTPYGTGVMYFERLFDQFADPSSLLQRTLYPSEEDAHRPLDAVCQAEITALIARAPELLVGTTELTTSAFGIEYRLNMADDLAAELADLVAAVPPAPAQSDRLMEFAFGIRIGAARDFLLRKMTAIKESPYQCEKLQDLNAKASEALIALNRPVPPLVNNFLGLRASIGELPSGEADIATARGKLALHVNQPEMFVGMAQMFLPDLAELKLVSGEPPVRLPERLTLMPGVVAFAAMSQSALGIAVGQGEEAGLREFLSAPADNQGSFLSLNYDLGAYIERSRQLTERWGGLPRGGNSPAAEDTSLDGPGPDGDDHGEARPDRAATEALQQALLNFAGRNHLALRFDGRGFAVESRISFADKP